MIKRILIIGFGMMGKSHLYSFINSKHKYQISIYDKKNYSKIEISNYLNDNPLPINEHGFLSGRHRVAAMIGRILRGEKYIPFNVYKT